MNGRTFAGIAIACLVLAPLGAFSQDGAKQKDEKGAGQKADRPPAPAPGQNPFGQGGPPPFGPGGPGGPMGQERKIVKQFDKNGDGWLNNTERKEAREFLKKDRPAGRGGMRMGPPGGFGRGNQDPPKPGPKVSPADVRPIPKAGLYDATVLRTLFLEFENEDWEAELADFHGTDVEVPATLTVDGKKYPNVGVHFRGMSSYMTVPAGSKRSLNLSLDLVDKKQRLYGAKTLNLLNSHEDATFMSSVLYSHISRQYIPAPKANFAKVVINGESWGVYANTQQFNKEFLVENYKTSKGARWKVRGSPGGGGGMEYLGDNVADYKRRYQIKSEDDPKAWQALISLCKILNETPPEKLEAALAPIVDIDNLLWFLALDVTLINCDGYWIRASDYALFRDDKGKFHFIPHDMNEAFRPPMGPGMGGPGMMAMGGMGRGQGGRGGPGQGPGGPGQGPGGPPGPGGPGQAPGAPPGLGGPGQGPGGPAQGAGGPGNFMFRFPPPGEVFPGFLQDVLELSEQQRKQVAEIQKDVEAKLDKILSNDQRARLKEMRSNMPMPFGGGFGPGGPMGPGGPGGQGMGPRGVDLDPLVGITDARKPLRSKVLAVPALRTRYLQHVKTIAEDSLNWEKLGPVVARHRALIEKEIEADTRKLEPLADFKKTTADKPEPGGEPSARRGPPGGMNLRAFADQRREYLLNHPEVKKAAATKDDVKKTK